MSGGIHLSHPLPGHKQTGFFGYRPDFWENGIYIPPMNHNGADFGAPAGTPIRAAHDGTISRRWWDTWADGSAAGGNAVAVAGDGFETQYYHMRSQSPLAPGTKVRAGDVIGHVGMTGTATGNHLHFMLRTGGKDIDPVPYISGDPIEGDEDMTPEQDTMLREVHAWLADGKAGSRSRGRIAAQLDNMPGNTAKAVLDAVVTRTGVDAEGKPRTGDTSLRKMVGHHEHQIGLTRRIVERIESIVKTLLSGEQK